MLGVRPVLVREIRTLSRQRSFYGIRAAAGAVALCVLGYIWLRLQLPPTQFGSAVFTCMANLLFCAIWVIGPLISSDCISSEKREGTLPLLFLTPLRPGEIILAKLGAQLLRTGTLLIAVIPVLVIPLLFGGVTWMDVARAILLNFSALLISLTIGAFASTLTKRRAFGSVLAFLLSVGTSVNFVAAYLVVRSGVWGGSRRSIGESFEVMGNLLSQPAVILSMIENKLASFSVVFGLHSYASVDPIFAQAIVSRSFSRASMTSVQVAGMLLVLAILGILIFHFVATFQLRRFWREHPASPVAEKAKRLLFRPVLFESRFRRMRQATLTKNPILGISSMSVGNRLHKWWLLLALIIVSLLDLVSFGGRWRYAMLDDGIAFFELFLVMAVSYVACSGTRDEKGSGVLELLLVTPLKSRTVAFGRLISIIRTFGMAIAGVFALMAFSRLVYSGDLAAETRHAVYSIALFASGSYLMISAGFWFSIRKLNVVFATFLAASAGYVCVGGLSDFVLTILDVAPFHLRHEWLLRFVDLSTAQYDPFRGLTSLKAFLIAVNLVVPILLGTRFLNTYCRDLEERRFVSG